MKNRVDHIGRSMKGSRAVLLKRSLKKQTVRARRRAEKDFENAPTQLRHLVRGYAD